MEKKKLEDRRFVAFDAAVIDKDLIDAAVEITQEIKGADGNTIFVPVTVVLLSTGSSVTLGSTSREKFIRWWRDNVKAEKVELPELPASEKVVDAVVPTPPAPVVPPMVKETVVENSPPVEPAVPEPPAPPLVPQLNNEPDAPEAPAPA